MRFIVQHRNDMAVFKLIKHLRELQCRVEKDDKEVWRTVDIDSNLKNLLARHKMLDFTEAEIIAAKMFLLTDKWKESEEGYYCDIAYCKKQAQLILTHGDSAIERIASQIIDPQKLVNIEHGLPTWARRLTLAFVKELGVEI